VIVARLRRTENCSTPRRSSSYISCRFRTGTDHCGLHGQLCSDNQTAGDVVIKGRIGIISDPNAMAMPPEQVAMLQVR